MSTTAGGSTESEAKRRVAYFYDSEIGNFHYGQGHPMKPHRVRMTHNLVVNYGLYRQMEVFRPKPVSAALMTRFHSDEFLETGKRSYAGPWKRKQRVVGAARDVYFLIIECGSVASK